MIILEVANALDGERVDRVVAMVTDLSRARAAELVGDGAVQLDGRPVVARSTRVRSGQELAVDWTADERPLGPQPDAELADKVLDGALVAVDADVIVVDKPAGIVVHPGSGVADGTLVNALLARFPELAQVGDPARPGIVHRLDRGTSGLLVVARSPAAYTDLVSQLAEHRVQRTYRTVVQGIVEAAAGLIDAPIGRSSHDPTRRAVRQDGKDARTRYHVEGRYHDPVPATQLRCELETGRTHQVRVHLQAVGHPVLGDDRYGGRTPPGVILERPFLHAIELAFDHPDGSGRVSYAAALPADLETALAAFR